jgi:hypothetical protein
LNGTQGKFVINSALALSTLKEVAGALLLESILDDLSSYLKRKSHHQY